MKPSRSPVGLVGILAYLIVGSTEVSGQSIETWSCTYPGSDGKNVTVDFHIRGDERLVSDEFSHYTILENSALALIAEHHHASFDPLLGRFRINSTTIELDKTFGRFIYMSGEIGMEPAHRTGQCRRDNPAR